MTQAAAGSRRGPYAVGVCSLAAVLIGGLQLLTLPAADFAGGSLVEQSQSSALASPLPSPTSRSSSTGATPARPAVRVAVKARPATAERMRDPDTPEHLTLTRLGLSMPIVPTQLNARGQMRMPDRPSTIGWYSYGPVPGAAAGSAVLAGHVDTREYGIGPLAGLAEAKVGDRLVVDGAKGRQTFVVERVQLLAKQGLDYDTLFRRDGPGRLRVVTCGGAYRPDRGGYQDNVVVTAARR